MFVMCMALTLCLLGLFAVIPKANASMGSPGGRALSWAEAHAAGCWYTYGGTNCAQGYDCSGLVSTAIMAADHIWIGRDTFSMLGSNGNGHLVRVWNPQRGDLAFYGTGHVEFVTSWYHMTFGAHDWGTRVGWISYNPVWGWAPTMFYRVVW